MGVDVMFLKGRNSPVIGRLVNELGKGIVLDAVLEEGLEICISYLFTSSNFGNDFITCKSPFIFKTAGSAIKLWRYLRSESTVLTA